MGGGVPSPEGLQLNPPPLSYGKSWHFGSKKKKEKEKEKEKKKKKKQKKKMMKKEKKK